MNKDVIYIDVEDDITAIISKVKSSKQKIVALVPPKRTGVLQSAVNLRLLSRTAEQSNKRLVVITNNHALMGLTASAGLPVAKNLQSKPEIAPIAALDIDDGEDVIDGNDLPIGEHAKQAEESMEAVAAAPVISTAQLAQPPKGGAVTRPRAKKGNKVPNFNTFRKKLILAIVGLVLLIGFIVWALVFAPRATIVVSAKTSDSPVNAKVDIGDSLTTDFDKSTIKATKVVKSEKKSIDFAATGSKNVGEKARGTVEFSTNNISNLGTTIPAGTSLTAASGVAFLTDESVTITINNYQSAITTVTAAQQGAKYNAASGSVQGAPNGIAAQLVDPTSGGTDKVVKVVTESDVQKAKETLVDGESASAESELKDQLKAAKVISGSYRVDYGAVTSSPDVGAETESGNATLSATVTYALFGLSDAELSKFLDAYLKEVMNDNKNQRVYQNGSDEAKFQDVNATAQGAQLTLVATAKVGPGLQDDEIKKLSLGQKTGEIQESFQPVQGIEEVTVQYFPFWVNTVPNDADKVSVQFKVDGEK
jgi:hypothetical protein